MDRTFIDLFNQRVATSPDKTALLHSVGGNWEPVSWVEFDQLTSQIAYGQMSLRLEPGDRIGLLGGFDMDFLCTKSESEVYDSVLEQGRRFRATARGYALGSGNSIPDYVPVENYLAMIRAAQALRAEEAAQ